MIGIDASLTRFALVEVDGYFCISKANQIKTYLSLKSNVVDILVTAREIHSQFNNDYSEVFIDLSKAQGVYPGGKVQKWVTGIFLGSLAAHFKAVPVSQNDVRRVVGLSNKASKVEVHAAYGVGKFTILSTDDLKDAYIIAIAGYKLNKEGVTDE